MSGIIRDRVFGAWLPLLSGGVHVIAFLLLLLMVRMPLGECITSPLFIPLRRDTWVVMTTGAIPSAAGVDVLGHTSCCTCEMHFR